MALEHIETTIFTLNNVNLYCTSAELVTKSSFGHAIGLSIIGLEEFVRAMNFYLLACEKLNPVEEKKILNNIDKPSTGNFGTKISESAEVAMQIVLTRWLQAKPESFEILINYLTATTDFEKNTFLEAMVEYLRGDTSNYAITFRQLLNIAKEDTKNFSRIKKDPYFYVSKNNTSPITSKEEDLEQFSKPLKVMKDFADSILDFLKELFMNKELFEKYVKFDNNVRLIWPGIYKRF